MSALESGMAEISCPYCGETLELSLDASAGEQSYIEDCQVCCRPIECHLHNWMGEWQLEVKRDDE